MFIDIDSLKVKISGGSYLSLGQYLVEAKYGYHKLWGSDSGRNLAGVQSGTLIGIFPKITVQFRKLTRNELETICRILDSSEQTVRYYDPNKRQYVEMQTYTGDYEIVEKKILTDDGKMDGFSCAFISRKKRG